MITSRIIQNDNVKILIHDDYCSNVNKVDISDILAQIGALISNSYCHSGQTAMEQSGYTMQKAET